MFPVIEEGQDRTDARFQTDEAARSQTEFMILILPRMRCMIRDDSVDSAVLQAFDDGRPVNVEWDEDRQEYGYYGAPEGWTAIDPVRLSIYRPDLDQFLDDLLDRKLRKPAGGMFRVAGEWASIEMRSLPGSFAFTRSFHKVMKLAAHS